MAVNIEIKGREKALAKIGVFQLDVMARIKNQLDESTKAIRDQERRLAPTGKTKKYKQSIKRILRRKDLSAKVGPMRSGRLHPLAHLLERGTQPHLIHPFGNKNKTVMHPGTKPQPHVEPAWEREKSNFIKGIEDAVKGAKT